MGKTKYLRDVLALFEKSPIVNYDSIKRIIYGKKKAGNYTKKLIYVLLSKGKIKRLANYIPLCDPEDDSCTAATCATYETKCVQILCNLEDEESECFSSSINE